MSYSGLLALLLVYLIARILLVPPDGSIVGGFRARCGVFKHRIGRGTRWSRSGESRALAVVPCGREEPADALPQCQSGISASHGAGFFDFRCRNGAGGVVHFRYIERHPCHFGHLLSGVAVLQLAVCFVPDRGRGLVPD